MRRLAHLIALVVGLSACTSDSLRSRCHSDADCLPNFTCEKVTGACHCTSNAACADGQICNGVSCQVDVGCQTSLDCPPKTFCDVTSGRCLDEARCTSDVQCNFGQICDPIRYQCVPGCHEDGDCPLRQVCQCDDGGTSCALGQCQGNTCDDDSFCLYGERCLPGDDGKKHCVKDERGPFCQQCTFAPGMPDGCGDGPNFCLLDRKVSYYNTYCGVDCSQGQECPYGYHCRDILILTHALCMTDADCPANGPACQTDADCPMNSHCDATMHRCAGHCSYNEDSRAGFCECTQDSDCPNDGCNTIDGRCFITKKPCTPNGHECDLPIFCVQTTERSACKIGRNCTPIDGVTCEQVNDQMSSP